MRYHGQLRLPFSLLNNQKPGFFRLIGVEDDADEETQALHDQETGRSVPLHFDPALSGYCNRGMVCLPVRIWSHAYDLCGKANPRTMWLWESMRSFSKAVPSCYDKVLLKFKILSKATEAFICSQLSRPLFSTDCLNPLSLNTLSTLLMTAVMSFSRISGSSRI